MTFGNVKIWTAFVVGIMLAAGFSGLMVYGLEDGSAGPDVYIEPGSGVETASYIIYKDGDYTCAKNGTTGKIVFRQSNFADVLDDTMTLLTNGGGKIAIKPGSYDVDKTISVATNGIYLYADNVQINADDAMAVGVIDIGADNVTIYGMHVEAIHGFSFRVNSGENTRLIECVGANGSSYGFYIRGGNNTILDSCVATGAGDDGYAWTYGYPSNSSVVNCRSYANEDAGYEVGDNGGMVSFVNCFANDNGYAGFTINNHVDSEKGHDVTIIGCQIYNCVRGITLGNQNTSSRCSGVVASNNVIKNCLGGALNLNDSYGIIFSDNYVENSALAIIAYGDDVQIKDNYCDVMNAATDGITVDVYSTNVQISGNRIMNTPTGRDLIRCYSDGVKITDNILSDSARYGIRLVNVDQATISGNTIYDITTHAIRLETVTKSVIIGNVIKHSSTGDGAIVEITSDYNTICENSVSNYTTLILKTGTNTIIRDNIGYKNEAWGTGSLVASKAASFSHGLAAKPLYIYVYFNNTGFGSWSATSSATTIWLGTENTCTLTYYWYAFF